MNKEISALKKKAEEMAPIMEALDREILIEKEKQKNDNPPQAI